MGTRQRLLCSYLRKNRKSDQINVERSLYIYVPDRVLTYSFCNCLARNSSRYHRFPVAKMPPSDYHRVRHESSEATATKLHDIQSKIVNNSFI